MIDDKCKTVVNNILSSETFAKSTTYQGLLDYLYKATLKGEQPKETTIAIDLFHRDESFSPVDDSIVRFHMYKLRKKLEEYFLGEGKDESIVVRIPKGKYMLECGERKLLYKNTNTNYTTALSVLSVCLFILLCVVSFLYFSRPGVKNSVAKNNALWKSVFSNDYNINVVIGDFFVFEEYDTEYNKYRRIMDYYIDTPEKFKTYQQENPDRKSRKLHLGELPHDSIFNLHDISHVFYSYGKTYDLIMATDVTVSDFRENNFIYLGQYRNTGKLQLFLDVVPAKINPITDGTRVLSILDESGNNLKTFKSENLWDVDTYNLDYGMIAKLPGYHDEQMIFICGFGYFSKIDLGRMVSYQKGVQQLEKLLTDELGHVPDYFVMIFQMYGREFTGYTSELQFAMEIDADRYKQSLYNLLSGDE